MRIWPAYGAAVCTFAYGALKLYWALRGGFLAGEVGSEKGMRKVLSEAFSRRRG